MTERFRLSPAQAAVGSGELVVQVTSAGGAIPIENAVVKIMRTNGALISTLSTNQSGRTAAIRLSAPNASLSQSPRGDTPYALYRIYVTASGYAPAEHDDVSVFDGVLSIQPVSLQPE